MAAAMHAPCCRFACPSLSHSNPAATSAPVRLSPFCCRPNLLRSTTPAHLHPPLTVILPPHRTLTAAARPPCARSPACSSCCPRCCYRVVNTGCWFFAHCRCCMQHEHAVLFPPPPPSLLLLVTSPLPLQCCVACVGASPCLSLVPPSTNKHHKHSASRSSHSRQERICVQLAL